MSIVAMSVSPVLFDRKRYLLYSLTNLRICYGVKKHLLDFKLFTISFWYSVLNNPVRRFLHFHKFFMIRDQECLRDMKEKKNRTVVLAH
jgi:hypothetical protein